MSKAFTRESDDAPDAGLERTRVSELPPGSRNYMTPAGARRLREELDAMTEQRAAIVGARREVPDGDASGASDQAQERERLRELERRMAVLTEALDASEVVDPAKQDASRVAFGAVVTVHDEDSNERVYRIVGIDEVDARRGWVSWLSPIARALLNARVGDEVKLRTPRGEEDLEVVAIEYPAE